MHTDHTAAIDHLLQAAIVFDRGDARRIQHLLKVHTFAALIGRLEGLDDETQYRLEAAAVLHDIGIHEAERTYGSSAGKYQELTGPRPARGLLAPLGFTAEQTDRICWLIAHHHTYTNVEGSDYQILLEADFLVNAYEDNLSADAIRSFRDRIFRTRTGIELLNASYGLQEKDFSSENAAEQLSAK